MSLTNSQYDEIIREYNRIGLAKKREQTERINYIYEKFPRIKEINDEISSISLNATLSILQEDADSEATLNIVHEAVEALKSEKQKILADNNFPSDYLDLHYICNDCKDTGYIDNKKCHCFIKAEINLLYEQSNINDILKNQNFDKFNMSYFSDDTSFTDSSTGKTPRANMEHILLQCKDFIENFDKEDRRISNMVLFGNTGVGKSFLSYCIAKEIIEKRHSVIYLGAINFFDILSSAEFNRDDVSAKAKAELIRSCDLLIIDDLGTELSNSFTNSAFFNIVAERLLKERSTIISTNLDFGRLMERYSERITSRLTKDYTFLKLYGEDLRHKIRLGQD